MAQLSMTMAESVVLLRRVYIHVVKSNASDALFSRDGRMIHKLLSAADDVVEYDEPFPAWYASAEYAEVEERLLHRDACLRTVRELLGGDSEAQNNALLTALFQQTAVNKVITRRSLDGVRALRTHAANMRMRADANQAGQ